MKQRNVRLHGYDLPRPPTGIMRCYMWSVAKLQKKTVVPACLQNAPFLPFFKLSYPHNHLSDSWYSANTCTNIQIKESRARSLHFCDTRAMFGKLPCN